MKCYENSGVLFCVVRMFVLSVFTGAVLSVLSCMVWAQETGVAGQAANQPNTKHAQSVPSKQPPCYDFPADSWLSFDVEVVESSLPNVVQVGYQRELYGEKRSLPYFMNRTDMSFLLGSIVSLSADKNKNDTTQRHVFIPNEKYNNDGGFFKRKADNNPDESVGDWFAMNPMTRVYGLAFAAAQSSLEPYRKRKNMPADFKIPTPKEITLAGKYGPLEYPVRIVVHYRKNESFNIRPAQCPSNKQNNASSNP